MFDTYEFLTTLDPAEAERGYDPRDKFDPDEWAEFTELYNSGEFDEFAAA